MDKLFVYGIFLDEGNRNAYGMSNPHYATVPNWATVGGYIVEAVPCKGATLTGLLVDMDETRWERLDQLERGYIRTTVQTTEGINAYMYAGGIPDEEVK